jgi:hypothetical protein
MQVNDGYKFEQVMYDHLKQLGIFDEIIYESDLRKRWGWRYASIDYLLVYKNKLIALQMKWRKSRRRENIGVTNFIQAVNQINSAIQDKEVLFGLYVSRREPFVDNQSTLNSNNIHCIWEYNSMIQLVDHVTQFLKVHLTSN